MYNKSQSHAVKIRGVKQPLWLLAVIFITFGQMVSANAEKSMVAQAEEEAKKDLGLQAVYKMPHFVSNVAQVCPWRSKSGQGLIRLTQTEQLGAHQLYVQWVRQGMAGTETHSISTIAIDELNKNGRYRFDMPSGELEPGACKLTTEMEDIRTQRRFRITLHVQGPGKYQSHVTRLLDGDL